MNKNNLVVIDNAEEVEILDGHNDILIDDLMEKDKEVLIKYIKNEDIFLNILYHLYEKEDMEKLLKIRLLSGEEISLSKIFRRNLENMQKYKNIKIRCKNKFGEFQDYLGIDMISKNTKNGTNVEIKFKLNSKEGILVSAKNYDYYDILESYSSHYSDFIQIEQDDNPKFLNLIIDVVYDKNIRDKQARSYFEL
jgi:hypothetical protein